MIQRDSYEHRTCSAKVRHDSYLSAYVAMRKGDRDLDIYRCSYCSGYHVGHSYMGVQRVTRLELMRQRTYAGSKIKGIEKKLSKIGGEINSIKGMQGGIEKLAAKKSHLENELKHRLSKPVPSKDTKQLQAKYDQVSKELEGTQQAFDKKAATLPELDQQRKALLQKKSELWEAIHLLTEELDNTPILATNAPEKA